MNKKIKFIAPALCGVILSSSLAFTNVQAAPTNKNVNKNISLYAGDYPSNYTLVHHFSRAEAWNMCVYMKIKYSTPTITETTFRAWLINDEDVPSNIASEIAPYLWDLGPEYIADLTSYDQKALDVVQTPSGNYKVFAD